jgi:hemolysin III
MKPSLRGVSHQYAFFVAAVAGGLLVAYAPGGEPRIAAAIYAISLCALFGASALYHRVNWTSPGARMWMRRLDHSMIFVLIAGTYTPFALLVLEGTLADVVLAVVWGGALAGILVSVVWPTSPKWITALICVALGWVAIATLPQLVDRAGVPAVILIGVGGVLYSLGALAYAKGKPNPVPGVFGYHEVFHALVIAAAACHFAAIALYAL